jgi:hypothetical protein
VIRPIIIRLTPEMVLRDDIAGARRRAWAIMRGAKHTNGWNPSDAKAMWKNKQAVRCEDAAHEWLKPINWNLDGPEGIGGPDLGDFIDVKGVELPHHRLLVQQDAKDHYAYLLVDSWQDPDFAIIGWVWGHEGKTHPLESLEGEDRLCHVVERACPPLRPLQELYDIVRAREAKGSG